jgi:hypothetical protein
MLEAMYQNRLMRRRLLFLVKSGHRSSTGGTLDGLEE